MIQRDVIQRLIHQLSAVLARLIGKNVEEQLIILEEYVQQQNGLSIEDLDKFDAPELLHYLSEDLQMNPYQIEAIAGVMNARGDVLLTDKKTAVAITNFEKAIFLLDFVDTETAMYSFDRNDLIASIKNKLKQLQ